MDFSKRIKEIVDLIEYRTIVDIGTDHCYIPILAFKNGKIDKAVATDINKGPLLTAQNNVNKEGLSEKIELRLSDGLSKINKGDGETLIIAGMGGLLIIEILEKAKELIPSFQQIILQPQSDIDKVRKFLHDKCLQIYDERLLFDTGKYYNIIDCRAGREDNYTEKEYIFGKKLIEKKDKDFMAYLSREILKYEKIALQISENTAVENQERAKEINEYIKACKELMDNHGS